MSVDVDLPPRTKSIESIIIPESAHSERLPGQPFSEREHVQLLAEAAGLTHEDLLQVKEVLMDALQATAAKDITVSQGGELGAKVQRVQEDLANHDVRLEAADKLLKLFDLYPKKGASISIAKSNVVVNPRFLKKGK